MSQPQVWLQGIGSDEKYRVSMCQSLDEAFFNTYFKQFPPTTLGGGQYHRFYYMKK